MAAVAADVTVRGLALWSGGPLDFGPGMWVLVAGQILAVAAAVVGIAVLLGVDTR